MTTGIWLLGDQLGLEHPALQGDKSPVLMIESLDYARQRPYHGQKLVLVWSAMRHFAAKLREMGWSVTYGTAEDFLTPLQDWVESQGITELWVMRPRDSPFADFISTLNLSCQIKFLPNSQFLWSREDFQVWAKGRKRLILEDFYREGRKRFNILMEGDQPVGGKWNFDKENRNPPNQNFTPPPALQFTPDVITQDVINLVKERQLSGYGKLEPFSWGVTREEARQVLDYFVDEIIDYFGTYQDAMVTGEKTLWHSLLSPYLNLGLLYPREVLEAVERAYYEYDLPLNSVEGLIRQILGWREYLYGVYHYFGSEYQGSNWFRANNPLPEFFWDAQKTDMNCLKQVLFQVEKTGYAHHIQRLMILSNFALLTGISPQGVKEWFHAAFIDAYDWVMVTNVLGMGLFADGGKLASKPYCASANYINKMSDYCKGCVYSPKQRTGEGACPFNYLYWTFLGKHREKLSGLGRMNFVLANLKRFSPEELQEMEDLAMRVMDNG